MEELMGMFSAVIRSYAARAISTLGLIVAISLSANAVAATSATGQGYGLLVDAGVVSGGVGLGVALADTAVQNAPPDFDSTERVLGAVVSAPDLIGVTAGVVNGHTDATLGLNAANSSGGVTDLVLGTQIPLLSGLLNLSADVIGSEATASCTNGAVELGGTTTVSNLNLKALGLDALSVDGTVAPNTVLLDADLGLDLGLTVITVAHLKVTLNEQLINQSGDGIEVNALHLQLTVLGLEIPLLGTLTAADVDVVIGHSAAQLADCALPEVSLLKELASGGPSAAPGDQLGYTITLTNSGGLDATGYAVIDRLDTNVTLVSADNGGVLSGNDVNWTNLTVPANGSLVLNVTTLVNSDLTGVTSIGNVAFETGDNPPVCEPGDRACVDVPVATSVTLAKALASGSPTVATFGDQLSYTITLTNSSDEDVTGYAVTDQLDPNVTLVFADNGG